MTLSRIAPLLPAEGSSVCFAGNFDGAQALTVGWPHQTKGVVHVTSLALRLDHPKNQTPHRDNSSGYYFDWRYEFTLLVKTGEGRDFLANGQCDWTNGSFNLVEWQISCFIDCDGGDITFTRFPVSRGLRTIWEPGHWLRMTACGEGSEILRAEEGVKSFVLEKAAQETCSQTFAVR